MKRALLVLALLAASCGDNVPPVDVSGVWSYAWPAPQGNVLHGDMPLTQRGSNVFGEIGYPVDYPAADESTWHWSVWGQVDGDRILIYADDSGTSEPWWFDVTVTGDAITGPALAGYQMQNEGAFAATRSAP